MYNVCQSVYICYIYHMERGLSKTNNLNQQISVKQKTSKDQLHFNENQINKTSHIQNAISSQRNNEKDQQQHLSITINYNYPPYNYPYQNNFSHFNSISNYNSFPIFSPSPFQCLIPPQVAKPFIPYSHPDNPLIHRIAQKLSGEQAQLRKQLQQMSQKLSALQNSIDQERKKICNKKILSQQQMKIVLKKKCPLCHKKKKYRYKEISSLIEHLQLFHNAFFLQPNQDQLKPEFKGNDRNKLHQQLDHGVSND